MNSKITQIGNYRMERELLRDERRVVYQGWQMSLKRANIEFRRVQAPCK